VKQGRRVPGFRQGGGPNLVKMINYDRFFSSWSGVAEKIFGCSVIAYEYKILNTRVVIIIFTFPQCFANTTNLHDCVTNCMWLNFGLISYNIFRKITVQIAWRLIQAEPASLLQYIYIKLSPLRSDLSKENKFHFQFQFQICHKFKFTKIKENKGKGLWIIN